MIRVLAVSAPELPSGGIGFALTSRDPVSLYNACRYAAFLAENRVGMWSESNWAVPRIQRRRSVLLMHSLQDDLPRFVQALEEVRPNLLLLGAMTPCLPGAVACATIAKEMFGDDVCVVLGGRHATETIYHSAGICAGPVAHHHGSPIRLMAEGLIPLCFDLVIAGEGEHLIPWLGETIGHLEQRGIPCARVQFHLDGVCDVPGNWIMSWCDNGDGFTVEGKGIPIDRNTLPIPCDMFGIGTAFDVFDGRLTAHAFSDTGPGCAFDCNYCSERRSTAGSLLQLETSATRLYRQLHAAVRVVAHDSPQQKASAFVEDSTILAGSVSALKQFVRQLERFPLDIRFGGQLTIDQITSRREILSTLKKVGLDYLFIGIETLNPNEIGGMSKDLKQATASWKSRIDEVLDLLSSLGIQAGSALLFGLGESVHSREQLFECLQGWRARYGMPHPVSINWAVQHPLKGEDHGMQYRYHEWGIPDGPFIEAFQGYGEASILYPIAGQARPTLDEVLHVRAMYESLIS